MSRPGSATAATGPEQHGRPRGRPPAITRQHSGDLAGFGTRPEQHQQHSGVLGGRRAPAYGSGGWGFESLAARTKARGQRPGAVALLVPLSVPCQSFALSNGPTGIGGPVIRLEGRSTQVITRAAALGGTDRLTGQPTTGPSPVLVSGCGRRLDGLEDELGR